MHQYAHFGQGRSIHSAAQLEWHQNDVNDRSIKVTGGLQCIAMPDGYVIPINIINSLPYIQMHPYTDHEWDTLPHVVLTSDVDWDPTVLDHNLTANNLWFDAVTDLEANPFCTLFDEFGKNYHHRILVQGTEITPTTDDVFYDAVAAESLGVLDPFILPDCDDAIDHCISVADPTTLSATPMSLLPHTHECIPQPIPTTRPFVPILVGFLLMLSRPPSSILHSLLACL
jgi:hypothetical protein